MVLLVQWFPWMQIRYLAARRGDCGSSCLPGGAETFEGDVHNSLCSWLSRCWQVSGSQIPVRVSLTKWLCTRECGYGVSQVSSSQVFFSLNHNSVSSLPGMLLASSVTRNYVWLLAFASQLPLVITTLQVALSPLAQSSPSNQDPCPHLQLSILHFGSPVVPSPRQRRWPRHFLRLSFTLLPRRCYLGCH